MMMQFDGYFLVLVQMLDLLMYLLHGNEILLLGVLRLIKRKTSSIGFD